MAKKVKNAEPTTNTLTFRKTHPKNRCSFGVKGVPGIVVFDCGLFADGKPPKTITVDCNLTIPTSNSSKDEKVAAEAK
jgi:hypothetical protein